MWTLFGGSRGLRSRVTNQENRDCTMADRAYKYIPLSPLTPSQQCLQGLYDVQRTLAAEFGLVCANASTAVADVLSDV